MNNYIQPLHSFLGGNNLKFTDLIICKRNEAECMVVLKSRSKQKTYYYKTK